MKFIVFDLMVNALCLLPILVLAVLLVIILEAIENGHLMSTLVNIVAYGPIWLTLIATALIGVFIIWPALRVWEIVRRR